MSETRTEGKDTIIILSDEKKNAPEDVAAAPESKPQSVINPEGTPILPNGEIDWSSDVYAGMPSGVCGNDFTKLITCFHNSSSNPKGSECNKVLTSLGSCLNLHPEEKVKFESIGSSE